jgi:phosphoribosylglycinamide formyltransferase-1
MKRIVILISGRGSNMEAIVNNVQKGFLKGKCEVMEVFSDNIAAQGLLTAQSKGLKIYAIDSRKFKRIEYNLRLLNHLQTIQPDLIVLAGYMKILPKSIVLAFPKKILNIHPADTKAHQGLDGYKWAFEQGLKTTKITVHYVDEGLDSGEIITQKEVNISSAKTLDEAEKLGLEVEHELYSQVIMSLIHENE